ncbi:hypothetical protein U1Q18_024867, partial [Sarracenia purpurea var. burkii]
VNISLKLNSAHLPLMVYSEGGVRLRRKGSRQRVYRFEQMWSRSVECKEIIKEGWEEESVAPGLKGLRLKLESISKKLSSWGWAKFGNIKKRIRNLREELTNLQASSLPLCRQEEE